MQFELTLIFTHLMQAVIGVFAEMSDQLQAVQLEAAARDRDAAGFIARNRSAQTMQANV